MKMSAAQYNNNRTEQPDQIALAKVLDYLKLLWCHVPNEGKRGKITGRLLKLQGLKKGFPDNVIFQSPPNYPKCKGAAIELKRFDEKKAKVSGDQEYYLAELHECGFEVKICYGIDDALDALKHWGYLK